ncbi:DUF4810 domain-containing protein [Ursidibacter sp. B-7004-1]
MKLLKSFILLLMGSLLIACSQTDNNIYYWGDYSDVVYSHYNEEGNFAKQEEALKQIITKAKEIGKPVAPGIYGHLGLVLLKQGKQAESQSALQEEQRLYPESSAFIQYLQRSNKGK